MSVTAWAWRGHKSLSISLVFICLCLRPAVLFAHDGMLYSDMINVAREVSVDLLEGRTEKATGKVKQLIDQKIRSTTNDLAVVPILNLVFEENAHRFEGIVHKLVAEKPSSVEANLLKGKFFDSYAWQARGGRFIRDTAIDAAALYKERIKIANQAFSEALRLDPKNFVAAYYLFRISKEIGSPVIDRERYFKIATTDVPFFLSVYLAKVSALSPKWGGSEPELFRFVADNAWAEDASSSLPFIVYAAFDEVCYEHGGKKAYFSDPNVWSEMERAFELLFKRYPKAAYFKVVFAKVLFLVKKKDRGLEMLKQAAELEPNHPEVLTQLQKHPEVSGVASRVGESDLSKADKVRQLAKESYKASDWTNAERLFGEVVLLDPTDAHSWYLLGFIQDKRGHYAQAILNFDRAIALRPSKETYYTYRCHSKMLAGRIEEGINDCTKAISINSMEKYAYLNRARAYQMIGKSAEAAQDLRIGNNLP